MYINSFNLIGPQQYKQHEENDGGSAPNTPNSAKAPISNKGGEQVINPESVGENNPAKSNPKRGATNRFLLG